MKELIDVFNMDQLTRETRIKIIIQLGYALNHNYGSNVTEPLVYELVKALDPNNEEIQKHHIKFI